ncbi:hypothetical protein SAMN06269117_11813 [Balnearium lithotrophicum]|uniref:DUF309 domain-containing protein n=1 Tax=Balnearium lithotrophicum TaxID=223788 RepID=A0A521D867_9BACT|nr:DUF309 domain-containing protein [Balnearium lithotrophicum]SMO67898.1 hypothetical protein SAMN06269117_11813 [Balnearium lithotrophicum]
MDFFEIRNWFAHNLCDYLREKEEKELKKLLSVISIFEDVEPPEESVLKEVSEEAPIFKLEGGKFTISEDPFTVDYVREKTEKYWEFLKELSENFEPVGEDLKKNVEIARELFKKGLYFEVHEILEEVWMGEFGEYRDFLQALIQIGVAYYHRENYNERGFKLLLENALELLSCYNGEVLGVKVDKLKEDIKRAKEEGTLIEF